MHKNDRHGRYVGGYPQTPLYALCATKKTRPGRDISRVSHTPCNVHPSPPSQPIPGLRSKNAYRQHQVARQCPPTIIPAADTSFFNNHLFTSIETNTRIHYNRLSAHYKQAWTIFSASHVAAAASSLRVGQTWRGPLVVLALRRRIHRHRHGENRKSESAPRGQAGHRRAVNRRLYPRQQEPCVSRCRCQKGHRLG